MRLVLATRRSALALAQSRAFVASLVASAPGVEVDELHVVTQGDKTQDKPLQDIGGKGLFVKELEQALLDGRADFAVHSMKDVPADVPAGLVFACTPVREDPRDVLVSRSGAGLMGLPPGARVGTGSLRRSLLLRAARPDLVIEPLRGNVDTRLRRVEEGAFDAVVLALAGLRRLGLETRASEILDPGICLPAIGQGALGVECRADDDRTRALLGALDHEPTAVAVAAERAVQATVEGNCRTPVAAHAVIEGAALHLRAMLAAPDGTNVRAGSRSAGATRAEAARAGEDLGRELLARG